MIYLDHNAGAPLLPQVARHLSTGFETAWGNPSSVHQAGRVVRRRLDAAREEVARVLGSTPREIVFTGSGSEAAAIGGARCVSCAEGSFAYARGDDVDRTPVCVGCGKAARERRRRSDSSRTACRWCGRARRRARGAQRPDRVVQRAVGEQRDRRDPTGVGDFARVSEAHDRFHCDAVQAFGRVPASLREVPAALLSLSAHKLGGPAGVGVLFNRRGVDCAGVTPGHQENGRRGGTQAIVFAEALAMALAHSVKVESARVTELRDLLEREILSAFPNVQINGTAARVGSTSNLMFPGADAEALLIGLDLAGVCVSTGAACASGSLTPSHVLLAMGRTSTEAASSLRFSLGETTTRDEVLGAVKALGELLRGSSL